MKELSDARNDTPTGRYKLSLHITLQELLEQI